MQFDGYPPLVVPHLIAGLIGLAAGTVALSVRKGAQRHRSSGVIFAYAMLVVAVTGILMATLKAQKLNLLGGLLTFYLVTTALRTVRRNGGGVNGLDVAALLLALTIGALGISFGIEASNSATGRIDGLPPAPAFMFGFVALLAAAGDIRMMARGVEGTRRVPRHLWRMCFALFSAASSFFPAQIPKVVPPLRGAGVLWIPSLLVLVLMFFWLWRVRGRWSSRNMAGAVAPRPAPVEGL